MSIKVEIENNSRMTSERIVEVFDNSNSLQQAIKHELTFGDCTKIQIKNGQMLDLKVDVVRIIKYFIENDKVIVEIELTDKNMRFASKYKAFPEFYKNHYNGQIDVCNIDILAFV